VFSLRTRRTGRRSASPRVAAADAAVTSVFVGAPIPEAFTDSVFDNALQQALHFRPQLTAMDAFRKQIIDFVTGNVTGTSNSLDIIADAPGGTQRMPTQDDAGNGTTQTTLHPLLDLLSDPSSTVDDDLVTAIKQRFVRCRLLGCVTAVDEPIRDAVKRMAQLLQIPIFGTLRTIAYTDFNATGFQDSIAPSVGESQGQQTLYPITPDAVRGGFGGGPPLAEISGIQLAWLNTFPRVKVTHDHLPPSPTPARMVWDLPFELIGARLPSTDVIRTAPLGFTVLRTQSGTTAFAEVLARGTLLRLPTERGSPFYINVASGDPMRHSWLLQNVPEILAIPF